MREIYVVVRFFYEDWELVEAFFSREDAEKKREELERIELQKRWGGCGVTVEAVPISI